MLTSSDYRTRAWNALSGKWGVVAITFFLVTLAFGVFGPFSAVITLVFGGPVYYGYATQSLNVMRGNRVEITDILAAKNRLTDTILAFFINGIYTFLWSLLFIIPGIIAAYSYSMTYYVLVDNPGMTADQARRKSMELMEGNKLRLFYLQLSFLGWILLCVLTFGILIFWVAPYIQCATAEFYDTLIPPRATVEHVSETIDIDPFDLDDESKKNAETSKKPEEPFYVFEEERPRENTDSGDANISGKK